MYYQRDYILRMIEDFANFVGKVFFKKGLAYDDMIDDSGVICEENFLEYMLKNKIYDGKINEAEQLLFEKIEANHSINYLTTAINFYKSLNELDDKQLNDCSYKREYIAQRLEKIKTIYEEMKRNDDE